MAAGAIPTTKNDKVRVNSSDTAPDYLDQKIVSSDNSVNITTSSCDCSLDLSAPGGFTNVWTKATVDYTDFNQALGTITIEPTEFLAFPAGSVVTFVKIKHTAAWTGGTVSNAVINAGYGALTTGSIIVFNAPADTYGFQGSPTFSSTIMSQTTTTNGTVQLTLTGDTGDNLTSGSCDIWFHTTTLL